MKPSTDHVAEQGSRHPRGEDLLKGLLLVAAILLAYYPASRAGFIWDDDLYVTNNPLLTASDGLRRIWFSLDSPSQYFPLTYTTFWIERSLWGLNPAGYHWVNILLHATNCLLLWRLLLRLNIRCAWFAAAIFALHPVQVESVAWVTERKNILMAFFFFLSLHAWIAFVSKETSHRWRYYALALCSFVLALSSKSTACTLPAALVLILWWEKDRIDWRRALQIAPFVMLGIAMGLLTVWWERYHQGTQGKLFEMGLIERILLASRATCFYLGKLFWPVKLTFSYPQWSISAANPLAYAWLFLALSAALAIVFLRKHVGRGLEVGAVFYVATLGPVLGFVMLYTFRYSFVADHYQYLACIGPVALAAGVINHSVDHLGTGRRILRPLIQIAVVLTLAVLTWKQTGIYMSSETVWRDTISKNPQSWLAYNNLGNDLLQRGKVDEAVANYKRALEANPMFPGTHTNLGVVSLHLGNVEESITRLRRALEIDPDYAQAHCGLADTLMQAGRVGEAIDEYQKAVLLKPKYAEAHNNLGNALLQTGRRQEAIAHYKQALAVTPSYAVAHSNLGNALLRDGQTAASIEHLRKALEIDPKLNSAHDNLGNALLESGRTDDSIAQYKEALRMNPRYAEAHYNLAVALSKAGKIDEAIDHYETAVQIKPDYVEALNNVAWILATFPDERVRKNDRSIELAERAAYLTGGQRPLISKTLAAAYANAGRFTEAVVTAEEGLRLAKEQGNIGLADLLRTQIDLYRKNLPLRGKE